MKRILNKATSTFTNATRPSAQPATIGDENCKVAAPTLADVTRYRYHHGTNLGSIFIQERWLSGYMYHEKVSGSSELAAVEGWVQREGLDSAKKRFEKHWREYVSNADLDWLRDVAKCTTVRLPLGYFTLGSEFCKDTPFERVAPVYENAWKAVVEICSRCHKRGIGVLIDVHGLPGGANEQDHSGTNSGQADFWKTRKFRDLATRALCCLASQCQHMEGCAGIQIINEAKYDAKGMYEWYMEAIEKVSKIDHTLPIYVSDGWDLRRAAKWSQGVNKIDATAKNPVVVDTHLYWCFNPEDGRKPAESIIGEVSGRLGQGEINDGHVAEGGAAQVVVGEYSCVLGEESWTKSGSPKQQQIRAFGNAQSKRFQARAGGSFFWTYRMDWMPGGEWGFKQMTEQQAVVPPMPLSLNADDVRCRLDSARAQGHARKETACGAHCRYWDSKHPGRYEHWRFEQGWTVGWEDGMAFFEMRSRHGLQGSDKIGMMELWVLKRMRDSTQHGPFAWEFEQGLRKGVQDVYETLGV